MKRNDMQKGLKCTVSHTVCGETLEGSTLSDTFVEFTCHNVVQYVLRFCEVRVFGEENLMEDAVGQLCEGLHVVNTLRHLPVLATKYRYK